VRLRIQGDIRGLDDDRQTKPLREVAAEGFIPFGRRPEPMIQVSQAGHGELAVLRKVEEEMRERHGIRPAGEANDHTRTRRAQRVPVNGAANLLMKKGCQFGGIGPPSRYARASADNLRMACQP
jgi:hypothetical protein